MEPLVFVIPFVVDLRVIRVVELGEFEIDDLRTKIMVNGVGMKVENGDELQC